MKVDESQGDDLFSPPRFLSKHVFALSVRPSLPPAQEQGGVLSAATSAKERGEEREGEGGAGCWTRPPKLGETTDNSNSSSSRSSSGGGSSSSSSSTLSKKVNIIQKVWRRL